MAPSASYRSRPLVLAQAAPAAAPRSARGWHSKQAGPRPASCPPSAAGAPADLSKSLTSSFSHSALCQASDGSGFRQADGEILRGEVLYKLKGFHPDSLRRSHLIRVPLCHHHPLLQFPERLHTLRDEHTLWDRLCVCVTQSCPTLCDSMDSSPPGFSVCGILQARILE